jgi:uncharacterized protein YjbI with pentapeptide repeats
MKSTMLIYQIHPIHIRTHTLITVICYLFLHLAACWTEASEESESMRITPLSLHTTELSEPLRVEDRKSHLTLTDLTLTDLTLTDLTLTDLTLTDLTLTDLTLTDLTLTDLTLTDLTLTDLTLTDLTLTDLTLTDLTLNDL